MEENLIKKENEVASNNNSNKNGIIAVLVIIIIALIGAVIYFAFIKKEEPTTDNNGGNNQAINNTNENNQTNNGTNQNNETENFKPWMKYILEQNITKIELSKVSCLEDNFGDTKKVVVTVNELKSIFKKFMNHKLQVAYIGGGGWQCGETLNIKYQKNGKEYELEYLGNEGHIVPSSDGCATIYDKDLENALNNSVDEKINEEAKGQEDVCTMYALLTDNYLLDEYFK